MSAMCRPSFPLVAARLLALPVLAQRPPSATAGVRAAPEELPLWCTLFEKAVPRMLDSWGNQTWDSTVEVGHGGWYLQFVDFDFTKAVAHFSKCSSTYDVEKSEVTFQVAASVDYSPYFWKYMAILVCHNRGEGYSKATLAGSMTIVLNLKESKATVPHVVVDEIHPTQVPNDYGYKRPEVDVMYMLADSPRAKEKVAKKIQRNMEEKLNDMFFNKLRVDGVCGLMHQSWDAHRGNASISPASSLSNASLSFPVSVPVLGTYQAGINISYWKLPASICRSASLDPELLSIDTGAMPFTAGMEWAFGDASAVLSDAGILALHQVVRVRADVDFRVPSATTISLELTELSWDFVGKYASSVGGVLSWMGWAVRPTIEATMQAQVSCVAQAGALWFVAPNNGSIPFVASDACGKVKPVAAPPSVHIVAKWLFYTAVYLLCLYLIMKCVESCAARAYRQVKPPMSACIAAARRNVARAAPGLVAEATGSEEVPRSSSQPLESGGLHQRLLSGSARVTPTDSFREAPGEA